MTRDILDLRIKDLEKALQESLNNYHLILGRLEESKYLLTQYDLQELANHNTEIEKL